MRRTRNQTKRSSPVVEDNEEPKKKKTILIPELNLSDDSSSGSDIENYLKSAKEIDLNSPFFKTEVSKDPTFEKIEENIFAEINRLSNSETDSDDEPLVKQQSKNYSCQAAARNESTSNTHTINFDHIHDYNKKMEETKKHIEIYKSKKKVKENSVDILDMLTITESKTNDYNFPSTSTKLNETSLDDEEEWSEVNDNQDKLLIPKKGIEITVQLPNNVRKKKGTDLMDILKRRVNRIKKETQVYVHKVHLLCWIAHGNHINKTLGSEHLMALTLSLLPSQQCFPPHRLNISYLEEILKWYKKNIKIIESNTNEVISEDLLEEQIMKKVAHGYKIFVYIFICLLRSLGVKCRLMLSLQVEPLRPSITELCSLKKENPNDGAGGTRKSTVKVNDTPRGAAAQSSKTKSVTKVISSKKASKNVLKKKNKLKVLKKLNFEDSCYLESNEKEPCATDLPEKPSQSKTKPNSNKNDFPLTKLANRNKGAKIENTTKSSDIATKGVKKKKPDGSAANHKSLAQKNEGTKRNKNLKNEDVALKSRKSNVKDISPQLVKTKPNLKNLNCTRELSSEKSDTAKFGNTDQRIASITRPTEYDQNIFIPQVDGGNDDVNAGTSKSKPRINFDKLKSNDSNGCTVKAHPKRLKQTVRYREIDSDEDFVFSDVSSKGNKLTIKNNTDKSTVKSSAASKSIKYKKSRYSENSTISTLDVRNDIINLVKQSMSEEKQILRKHHRNSISSDSEYEPIQVKKKILHKDSKEKDVKVKRRIPMKKDLIEIEKKRLIEKEEDKKRKGINVWAEIFAEAEEKWISVDVVKGQVHCVKEIYTRATHPVTYTLSWDNENHIKDLTKRYCVNWNTVTRKLRVDNKWWDATLLPYKPPNNARNREEDEELAKQQLEQPLPTTISEYKNHPLYVLKRHLLKFEALYPQDALILGFVRNEPVYSRECVHTLHSREIWLKHAKVVKPGEKPYKIVKARPKYDKLSNSVVTDKPLEIFGRWQVEDYVPPTAENGVVPRNAYGNVELFKPTMLPKGTVHLQLPGLNKTARKMNIDCAPAVVGFDFHGGWSHPTFDGFVVCEEYSEQLIAAWYQEQEESEKRAKEKIEKRVYENWRRLIKGLLIRERLKKKYDFGDQTKNTKSKKKTLTLKKRKILSDNESD